MGEVTDVKRAQETLKQVEDMGLAPDIGILAALISVERGDGLEVPIVVAAIVQRAEAEIKKEG